MPKKLGAGAKDKKGGGVAELEEEENLPEPGDNEDPDDVNEDQDENEDENQDQDENEDGEDENEDQNLENNDKDENEDEDENEDQDADEDESVPLSRREQKLQERIDALEKKIEGKGSEDKPKELTEDDWKKLEEDWGVAEKDGVPGSFGRRGIQKIQGLLVALHQNLSRGFQSEIAGLKKDSTIAELAHERGYEDIKGYRKGIEEFLSDFDVRHHSNKELLKRAYTYAVGLGAKSKIKKALNARDQKKKFNKGGGHGKPGGKAPAKSFVLSAEQKEAARKANMSEKEYIRYLTTDNLEDIPLPE